MSFQDDATRYAARQSVFGVLREPSDELVAHMQNFVPLTMLDGRDPYGGDIRVAAREFMAELARKLEES